MKELSTSGRLTILLLIASLQFSTLAGEVKTDIVKAEEPVRYVHLSYEDLGQADWVEAEKEVSAELVLERRDIVDVVGKVLASRPTTAQEAMFKLNVLMRAGMNKAAVEAVEELGSLCPMLYGPQVRCIYDHAWGEYKAWEVARRAAEVFADTAGELDLERGLFKHWLESGWSVERIDKWLAERPAGFSNFWLWQRLRFSQAHGRLKGFRLEMSERARKTPEDISTVSLFLDTLRPWREKWHQEWDLSWMTKEVKPKFATTAKDIGSSLKSLEQWEEAIFFFRLAIAMPLPERSSISGQMGTRDLTPAQKKKLQARFAMTVREQLAECLLRMDKTAEAEKWMAEVADIRKKHEVEPNTKEHRDMAQLSGTGTLDEQIKEEDEESKDDPRYWQKRAGHHRLRDEWKDEEEALVKGLSLTKPKPLPSYFKGEANDLRSSMLSRYAHLLKRMNREDEAVAVLRKEIAQFGSSGCAVHNLTHGLEEYIEADDEVLWTWLGRRDEWEYNEKTLLEYMLKKLKPSKLGAYFSRAEELIKGKHPKRAETLGRIMQEMGHAKRSIPLFKYVAAEGDKYLKKAAKGFLFEAYLDVGDWMRAERLLPEAPSKARLIDVAEGYARISVVAAAAGAKKDAMRLWRVRANADLAQPVYLKELADRGLKKELVAFYHELGKRLPGSEVPERALRILEEN